MAINIKFDLMGNPEPPSIVLANRSGNKLGQLDVNVESIDVSDKFNNASEFTFTLNKYIDDELTYLWDKVVDFKLVYCPEWDMWFEIKVELDEATETVKTVFCTQLGQAELSQIMLYNVEINTDVDIEREDYKTSILYDENDPKSSILHRLLEKAPHYSIAYVDESIQRIQRQFSFDGTSICDAFNEIAEEIGCLFVYNSNSQAGGKPNRTISVYDLQQNCNNKDCKHRGEFTDKCPKCGSTNITYGYGEDTTIFVTSDELATEGIQLVTDTDSVKNCFKLEAGDDLMTATIRNCNPNGTDYIWYFSDSIKEDMSQELVDRIEGYDELYQDYYSNHISELNETLVNQYNALVNKYKGYYDTPSTCLECDTEGDFEEQCSNCNSTNILTGQKLQTIPTTITGYPALMTAYYNTIDLLLYLESGLMPNVEMSDTNAEDQIKLLTTASLSPVAVNVKEIKNASLATANSAVLSMAKVLIRPTYKVDIVDGSSSLNETINSDNNGEYRVWTGKFVVTNYSDETDTATNETVISVRINNATETFIKQKIDKALNKENTDDLSISGLFDEETYSYDAFCDELKKYALNPLKSFYEACDVCLSILTEQGAGNEDEKPDLYAKLYKPYFDRQQAINREMETRENEIAIIEGVWDKSDENNPKCTTKGLQQYIEDCQKEIQDALNFEDYLGEDLWLEFCSYRREDKYSNSNYISDGLNNAELFAKANEFIEVAKEEIFKSAELQHSISANLNNLLALPKFKPLLTSFKTGNWIRVRIDDKVYKLRLLEYDFGYGDSKNISVEFSDVTKIKNGTTDVQDVFEQASSMATSYDSVQRQAKEGNVARSTIDQWIVDGLNSANVQIQSNDSEEIILTKNGLLARSYDDITGTYSPEQFKLTHNIMAYTDDNWETVSSALGKHNYKYYKDGNFIDAEGYGLSAKFAQAAYIIGSQMVGGEIVSSNYQPKQSGTYINLLNGDFDFAGGKIVYDASDNEVKLKGVTIQWTGDDGVNAPEVKVEDVSGLDTYLDQLDSLEDQLDGRAQTWYQNTDPSTEWTTDESKSLHEGDLWHYTGETRTVNGVNRIKNSEWVWQEVNGSYQWVEIQISDSVFDAIDGVASIYTTIPQEPVDGDLLIPVSDLDGGYKTGKIYRYNDATKTWSEVEYTDDTKANLAHDLASIAKTTGDTLVSGLGFQKNEIGDNYIISPSITGGYLNITQPNGSVRVLIDPNNLTKNNYIFQVHNGNDVSVGIDKDGNASFCGAITATSLTLGSGVTIPSTSVDELDSTIKGYGYQTEAETKKIVEAYGYQTSGDVTNLITGYGYQNEDDIKTIVEGYGYTTNDAAYQYLLNGKYFLVSSTQLSEITGYTEFANSLVLKSSISSTVSTETITLPSGESVERKTYTTVVPNSNGHSQIFRTYDDGAYVFTNIGIGKGSSDPANSSSTDTYVMIDKNGCLTADNAVIRGNIYAINGYFNGEVVATDGSFTNGTFDNCTISNNCTINGTLSTVTGNIGGFTIGTNSSNKSYLYSGDLGTDNSICLSTSDMSGANGFFEDNTDGGDDDINNWRLTVGSKFGVTSDGSLYADGANISGIITATEGQIGGWSLAIEDFSKSYVAANNEGEVASLTSDIFTDINGYQYQAYLTPKNLWIWTEEYTYTVLNQDFQVVYPKSWREISLTPEITVHNIKGGRRLLLRNPQDKVMGWQKYFDFMDKEINLNNTLEPPVILFKDAISEFSLDTTKLAHIPDSLLRIPERMVVYAKDITELGKPEASSSKMMGSLKTLDTFPESNKSNENVWHSLQSDNDKYFSYSFNCGTTWSEPIEIGTGKDALMRHLPTSYDIYSNGTFVTNIPCTESYNKSFNALIGNKTRYRATEINLDDIMVNNESFFTKEGTYHITVRARCDGYNESIDSNTKVYIVPKATTSEQQ